MMNWYHLQQQATTKINAEHNSQLSTTGTQESE